MKKPFRKSTRMRRIIATLALVLTLSAPAAYAGDAAPAQNATKDAAPTETATNATEQDERVLTMEEMKITAEEHEQGKAVIDRTMLDRLPSTSSSITETLRTQPNVQFDDGFGSSTQGGELTPPKISIGGGKYYQNAFTVDGLSINNRIDPSGFDHSNPSAFPGSPAQGMFLDTDLLEKVEVYTSNISAKHGGFLGGVVNAEIRDPSGEFGGKVKVRHTRDKWTNQRVADGEAFEKSSSPDNQPRFSKYEGSFSMDVPISEQTSALFAYDVKHATIPLYYMDGEKDQTRVSQNFLAKVVHDIDSDTSIDFTAIYAPYAADCFTASNKDSEYTITNGGSSFTLGLEHAMDLGTVEFRTGYSQMRTERDADNNIHTTWTKENNSSTQWGDNNKLAKEGGFGSAYNEQRSLSSMLDFSTREMALGSTTHVLNMGLAHENVFGKYEQKDDRIAYYGPDLQAGVIDNGSGGIIADEQYTKFKSVKGATSRSASLNLLGAYVEDEMSIGDLTLRPGIRLSYDDFMENTNLEPRFKATYDIFGDGDYTIIGGANRYYGAPLLTYALRSDEPTEMYWRSLSGNTPGPWNHLKSQGNNSYDITGLDTPYSDELMLGGTANLWGGTLSLEYVKREGHDQFASHRDGKFGKEYIMTNDGETEYTGYTISYEKMVKNHYFSIGATYSENETNFNDFLDSSNNDFMAGYDFDKVYYDGELINRDELPASNFNRPWVLTFIYSGRFYDKLTFTNTTRYVTGMRAISKDGTYTDDDGIRYYKYDDKNISDAMTFDWQIDYEAWKYKNQLLTLNLTVTNVFDATSIVDSDGNRLTGRQFWAGMTYEF
ncbi:TonB-dependent receptor plug domain-containing protein [Desulfobaculum sp. SPO524]|uniref:TonB-dependent receptor plug domain-containing protein n=1 Tax=Desulfobaculum sp. SPO524 TaxID=3378071 RepID=UPI003854DE0E